MKVQAILVNYHCASLTCGAAHSLANEPDLQLDVVDNSVSKTQQAQLRMSLPRNARLLAPAENLGFGRACNLAFESSNSEFVLLLNPDARLLPGALGTMLSTLRNAPDLAAVGPRVYWDDSKRFMMPLSTFPSRAWFLRSCLTERALPFWTTLAARSFRRTALAAWQASRPFTVDALSGGHVLLRRNAVTRAGGLFDPDYFMYWEDSDLMYRLKAAGYRLAQDPRAEALHLYSHSPAKDAMMHAGWATYARKHFGGAFWKLLANIKHIAGGRTRAPAHVQPLAWTSEDIELGIPETFKRWLLEISPSPDFVPAIGCLGTDRTVSIPAALLGLFSGCEVFFRLSPASPQMTHPIIWALKVPAAAGNALPIEHA